MGKHINWSFCSATVTMFQLNYSRSEKRLLKNLLHVYRTIFMVLEERFTLAFSRLQTVHAFFLSVEILSVKHGKLLS